MRLLAWNVNHRAARRTIPDWVGESIADQHADVVVLTEYVAGNAHGAFCQSLINSGLGHITLSTAVERQNQVLIATKKPHRPILMAVQPIHPAVSPNILQVRLDVQDIHVIGFRMPMFTGADRLLKRRVWEWLLDELGALRNEAAVIAGDFNTACDDGRSGCGDCLAALALRGWHRANPGDGAISYESRAGRGRLIDHAFVTPRLWPARAECSWAFRENAPHGSASVVGQPDHAMLLIDQR